MGATDGGERMMMDDRYYMQLALEEGHATLPNITVPTLNGPVASDKEAVQRWNFKSSEF